MITNTQYKVFNAPVFSANPNRVKPKVIFSDGSQSRLDEKNIPEIKKLMVSFQELLTLVRRSKSRLRLKHILHFWDALSSVHKRQIFIEPLNPKRKFINNSYSSLFGTLRLTDKKDFPHVARQISRSIESLKPPIIGDTEKKLLRKMFVLTYMKRILANQPQRSTLDVIRYSFNRH